MASQINKSAIISGLPFFAWEIPGKPVSIQLHFDVIDRMSPDLLRGLTALKRRGAEVGGILLGRIEDGRPAKVIVEDFEPVPSEYMTGPSYNLSEKDLAAFEAALERRKADPAKKLCAVGFYRSHTRDELYMDDADLALARRYFAEPSSVFLIVKPFATRPCLGGFFFWEDGEIARASTYLQFPFDRRELGGGQPRLTPDQPPQPAVSTRRDAAPVRDAPLPPYTPAPEANPPADARPAPLGKPGYSILAGPDTDSPPPKRFPWSWLLAPAVLALLLTGGFMAYRDNSGARVGQEAPLPLRLSVSEKRNQLDVTWDRNAPAVIKAKRGLLSISDGSNRRDLELTGIQLRNGRVLYSRLSGDVNLKLEVFPQGQPSVTESIRVVSTDAPPPVAKTAAGSAPPLPQTQITPLAQRPRPRPVVPSPAAGDTPPTPIEQPEVELPRPTRRR